MVEDKTWDKERRRGRGNMLEWRVFFALHDVSDIIDLLTREDLDLFSREPKDDEEEGDAREEISRSESRENRRGWRGNSALPPPRLVEYIRLIRIHSLKREVELPDGCPRVTPPPLARHVAVGMKPKKIHEVEHLARYVTDLSVDISSKTPYSISHFVDFGSGQNYLGRALASPPYGRQVVAIESKSLNIDGARGMDVTAKLMKKKVVIRNKKEYRKEVHGVNNVEKASWVNGNQVCNDSLSRSESKVLKCDDKETKNESNIQYIQTIIQNGDLSRIVDRVKSMPQQSQSQQSNTNPHLMVISLHSCGNLLHHGLRSLILNPAVKAVAMVGCCYNLVTERLSPTTYKLPSLRPCTPRLEQTSSACDPHGFPMSERFAHYQHAHGPGIRFNITARMMAVQAPGNWTETDCESFFTRHFYRALLQKILVDRGFFEGDKNSNDIMRRHDPQKLSRAGHPIVIGSLRKACYASFQSYVRGAVAKLKEAPLHREQVTRCMADVSNEEIMRYEDAYRERKKDLSVVWSLMAFSATVVESAIVVDRWQYLREQQEVRDCWVETAFEYKQSPRNLVVVGIKR
ncbi:MAG: hypothetical protein Q9167_001042 [Letrouitia subvulpina]